MRSNGILLYRRVKSSRVAKETVAGRVVTKRPTASVSSKFCAQYKMSNAHSRVTMINSTGLTVCPVLNFQIRSEAPLALPTLEP